MSSSHSSALMIGVSGIRGVIGSGFSPGMALDFVQALGEVGGERLILHSPAPQLTMIISSAVNELEWAYRGAIPRLMSK